ncbi:MAG: NRDE family protein [Gammaproteobacteria bacterium]|nr:NRDE family protein [Gammaproteobacteria bacterium]
MCLILFAWRKHADYPLIVIANRDEFYARPTRDAHWWDDADILAGRDLEAGGTWLGLNRRGHFAAVTNVREPGGMKPGKKTRGDLTRDYLAGSDSAEAYLQGLRVRDQDYAGFNLLLGDSRGLWFYSNREQVIRPIEAGVYGVSNGAFDEPWPKLSSGKDELEALLDGEIDSAELMEILTDHRIAEDHQLPITGVALDIERLLSSRFIRSPDYGTRACSVVTVDRDQGIHVREQNYLDAEHSGALVQESFRVGDVR